MRTFQVVIFGLGVVSFIIAIFFIGADMGNTLWRAGVALLLIDLTVAKLWPRSE